MTENRTASARVSADGLDRDDEIIPDLADEPWASRFDAAPLRRGRPRAASPKVQTTLRLDPEVVDSFKADGPGWQTRMNDALRKAAGL
ncbi:BrnA antitoxin family protein [Wenxinia saemankumensis]|uniref:BrnA antitoxin of type II toxin-antitoxin system n=1 Tax=Wenxinia saemankumensis TaxID=1447782 RepID=A0A1M6CXE4_9RHOB|nr:BrnA antitoxin family protein [Wenxinia saemankumensis]SHI65620.1 BrnA antitoxin of type II toxin-antitoxin system [Wenxinia saemankumensis]